VLAVLGVEQFDLVAPDIGNMGIQAAISREPNPMTRQR